ncbi:MAG: putative glycolipid-binding domain-containing protein [Bauldia sp.]|nr:putative glycolipid-binding domain-containing protein [Bauldia sp.]MCW5717426.1 putative glycolipid-binding domain-containing protein [Bauldia sp.]
MPQSRIVRWKPWSGEGLEHLELQHHGDAVNVHSVAIGEDGGAKFGVHYHLLLRPGWEFQNLTLDTARPGFLQLSLGRRNGSWANVTTGEALPELDGCIDIDIAATPFTNSLPIHRLALSEGESAEILVAHLAAPDFVPKPVRQRYTCLAQGRRYRFEALDGTGFTADLEVDADGLVVDYPGLFRRVG